MCANVWKRKRKKKFLSVSQRYHRKLNDRYFCYRGIIFLPAMRAGRLYDCRDSIFLSSIVVHFSCTPHSNVPPEVFRPIVDGIPRKIYGSLNWPPNWMLFLLETWLKFNVTVAGRFSQVHPPIFSFRLQIVGRLCFYTRCSRMCTGALLYVFITEWAADTREIHTRGLKNNDQSQVYFTGAFCLIKATLCDEALQCTYALYFFSFSCRIHFVCLS